MRNTVGIRKKTGAVGPMHPALYARCGATIYLLSIEHHRQFSFDLQSFRVAL